MEPTPPTLTIVAPNLTPGQHGTMDIFPGCKSNQKTKALRCKVDVIPDVSVFGYLLPDQPGKLFVRPCGRDYRGWWNEWYLETQDVEPFIEVEAVGVATTRTVPAGSGWSFRDVGRTKQIVDGYYNDRRSPGCYERGNRGSGGPVPWQYLTIRVTHPDTGTTTDVEMRFPRPATGRVSIRDTTLDPRIATRTVHPNPPKLTDQDFEPVPILD